MTLDTREGWLREVAARLAPVLTETGIPALVSLNLDQVRVSCGWPARGALAISKRRIGECWLAHMNKDGQSHVFVSPCLDNPVEVVGTLLHELLHAALPPKVKHSKTFAKAALAIGLEGKPTATHASEKLAARINAEILPHVGPYPHQAIDASLRPKQATRLRLYECQCEPDREAGTTNKVRVASDNWQATCKVCERDFVRQVQ